MELKQLPSRREECEKTIKDFLALGIDLDAVVILAIDKESKQHIFTSSMNQLERSFLLACFQAYVLLWFDKWGKHEI